MSPEAMDPASGRPGRGHAPWVRLVHWMIVAVVLTLAYSGIAMLVAYPRFYWGWAGNEMMRPLFELPMGPNYHHGSWERPVPFFGDPNGPVSGARTYHVFTYNSWARSLHFLVAWLLVGVWSAYCLFSLFTGHLIRDLLPRPRELSPRAVWRDIRDHLLMHAPQTAGGPPYGLLQKLAYLAVIFLALPVMLLSGLTMSPLVTAGWPWLLDLFGGVQSARTIHFMVLCLILLFLAAHLFMVVLTGLGRQVRAMTWGR